MAFTVALAGDTMLGRGVGERLARDPPESLWSPEVVEAAREADALVLNLECCVSDRGSPWPDPRKPFFFRAPPVAVEALSLLGVDCVTLANNHALDFGVDALLDTLSHLRAAGIATVGAGADERSARSPAVLSVRGIRLAVVAATDHPRDFAAGPERPGVAFADLAAGVPPWLTDTIGRAKAEAVLVTPHWGPNMTAAPVAHVRAAAKPLLESGASLIAGHSAHVFHGVEGRVLWDLGDFLDDYAVDADLRNDLGLLWFATLEGPEPVRVEALPLRLEYCHTRLAEGEDREWVRRRFRAACGEFGTEVREEDGRLVVRPGEGRATASARSEGGSGDRPPGRPDEEGET